MSSKIVLVTGSTGYLGFQVLLQALKSGYQVRAAVRSVEKAKKKLLSTPSLSSQELQSRLSFIEVPDILASGAYSEAIKGVDYVIHVASPVPSPNTTDFEKDLVEPAKSGTLEMLRAALSQPQIKRVVITSSVAANGFDNGIAIPANAHTRLPDPAGPYVNEWQAYRASKIIALNATEAFVKENNPSWDVISIQPGWIVGPNELATNANEFLSGTAPSPIRSYIEEAQSLIASFIHVQDAASVHVAALNSSIKGNRAWGAHQTVDWNDAWPVIEREFPEAVEKGVFQKRQVTNRPINWDASETEGAFGIKFKSIAEVTVDVAKQWLSLKDKQS